MLPSDKTVKFSFIFEISFILLKHILGYRMTYRSDEIKIILPMWCTLYKLSTDKLQPYFIYLKKFQKLVKTEKS